MDRITPAFILESARVVRETALSLRHTITAIRLVDLQKIFLNRSGTGGWQSESASHLLRDDRHASLAGCRLAWGAFARAASH